MYQQILSIYILHDIEKLLSILLKLQANLFRIDLRKMEQHTGGKWLIHGPKHRMDNQSQSVKHPCRIS